MKRLLASAATAALIASPLAAFAAPTAGELLGQLAMMTGATSSSLEVHGYLEGAYFAVWASGSQQGTLMDPEARAKWKATVDIVQGDTKMRLKVQVRAYQNTVYMKADAIEGDFGDLVSWNIFQGRWIKMTLEDGMMVFDTPAPMLKEMLNDPQTRAMLDQMFTMTENRFPGGIAYTLTPSQDLLAQMDAPPGTSLDMEIRVNTTNDWIANFAAVDLSMSDPSTGMWMTVTGKMQRDTGNVYVEIPADALTWQEFEWKLNGLFGGSMMPELPVLEEPWDMPMPEEWPDEEWTEDEWVPEPSDVPTWFDTCDAEPGTPDYLQQMRKGFCENTGPGPGSRDEKYRQ